MTTLIYVVTYVGSFDYVCRLYILNASGFESCVGNFHYVDFADVGYILRNNTGSYAKTCVYIGRHEESSCTYI
jgi:hypothetical protein